MIAPVGSLYGEMYLAFVVCTLKKEKFEEIESVRTGWNKSPFQFSRLFIAVLF
jgi:hypothetical protein